MKIFKVTEPAIRQDLEKLKKDGLVVREHGLGSKFDFLEMGCLLGIPVPVWISAIIVAAAIIVTKKRGFRSCDFQYADRLQTIDAIHYIFTAVRYKRNSTTSWQS